MLDAPLILLYPNIQSYCYTLTLLLPASVFDGVPERESRKDRQRKKKEGGQGAKGTEDNETYAIGSK